MTELLKTLPLDSKELVNYVCYHPIAAARLAQGKTVNQVTGEEYKPTCLAVDYDYESVLHEICVALGWRGGTIHQAVEEIKRLKEAAKLPANTAKP